MLVTVLFIIANNPAAIQLLNGQIHFGTSKQFCPICLVILLSNQKKQTIINTGNKKDEPQMHDSKSGVSKLICRPNPATPIHFCIVCVCFHSTMAELNS